jgi:hypothetical protein
MSPLTPKPPPTETVAIVVQNSLYASISAAVTQYRGDLNNTGYNTLLVTQVFNTHQELRGNLSSWYTTYSNFVGAVLIGRLPFAQFYHPAGGGFAAETFICDLYLMDLDGNWYDTGMPGHVAGVYDVHNASGSADIHPEIFIGRIDPQCLTWDTPANRINTYLARLHTYRTGGVQRLHRALVYIDDDWIPWETSWSNQVGQAYSNRTLVSSPGTSTYATDWKNTRLTQNYQWAHLCAHSSQTQHWFKPYIGALSNYTVTSAEVRAAPPSFNFYNLFCCHGAEWTFADNLAVTYVFSGVHSLGAIGSSKTGGMMDSNHFYQPLGQNQTLGDGLVNWMANVLSSGGQAGTNFLEWYYGINIVGDPCLTTIYDCTVLPTTITSSTHSDPSIWYTNGQPQFNWTIPVDVNGIAGYYYILDHNPSTVPTSSTGTYTTTNGTQPSTALADGIWYLHVVPVDLAGNVGTDAAHYQVNIDGTNPSISILTPIHMAPVGTQFDLNWTITETGSGYSYADIYVNGTLYTTVTSPITNVTITHLIPGSIPLNVTVYDVSGKRGSDQVTVTVTVLVPPGIPGFPLEAIAIGAIMAVGLGVYYRRKRKSTS